MGAKNSGFFGRLPLWAAFLILLWLPVYLYDTFAFVAFQRAPAPPLFHKARRGAIVAASLLSLSFIVVDSWGLNDTTVRLFALGLLLNSVTACVVMYRLRERDLRLSDQAIYVLCITSGLVVLACSAVLGFNARSLPELILPYRAVMALGTTLLVLGTLFIFSRSRFADVLIRDVLRIYWMGFVVLVAYFGEKAIMGLRWKSGIAPTAAHQLVDVAFLLVCMAVLMKMREVMDRAVPLWLFDEPDYDQLALNMQWKMQETEDQAGWFDEVGKTLCGEPGFAAARIVGVEELPGDANRIDRLGHEEFFPAAEDPLRTVTDPPAEVLFPIRVHGSARYALAVSRGPLKGEILHIELTFLRRVVRQLEGRLEARRIASVQRERKLQEDRLRAQITEAELRALRAQIQPHFLFNSLNTIAHLCIAAPEQAERMTTMLASIFRYVLTSTEDRLIPLEDEIRFIEDYLAIEQMRFGERLEIEIDIAPETRLMNIPPLILQPLVENALRHGLAPKIAGGLVRLATICDADTLRLVVEDTGVGLSSSKAAMAHGTHVGLANTRKRLECHYGEHATFTLTDRAGGGVRASITLPQPGLGKSGLGK